MLKKVIFILLSLSFLGSNFSWAFAQTETIALVITPPLIRLNVSPGNTWRSAVKIENSNPEDILIYISLMDFKSGEEGGVEFIAKEDIKEGQGFLLSEWVDISSSPIKIPAHQSKLVPFTINVPQNAEPGGHYAAILAGTGPLAEEMRGSGIKVSSLISCLILLNVQGEIVEQAALRNFSTEKTFYRKPEVEFFVQLENTGTVHLRPRGEIKIYNAFGKERGAIPLSQQADFGTVLPQSTKYGNFIWKGQGSFFEAGRYRVELVLQYGSEIEQTTSRTIYFWLLPIKAIIGILVVVGLFVGLMVLIIKIYLKRVVSIAREEAKAMAVKQKKPKATSPVRDKFETVIDLKRRASVEEESLGETIEGDVMTEEDIVAQESKITRGERVKHLIKRHFKLGLAILIFILGVVTAYFYFRDVLQSRKGFEIIIQRGNGGKAIISSEEIIEERELPVEASQRTEEMTTTSNETGELPATDKEIESIEPIDPSSLNLKILNGSGIAGDAQRVADWLSNEGFNIVGVANADHFNYGKTLIIYERSKEKEAAFLNKFFDNKALLFEVESQEENLVITTGKDLGI